MVSPIFSPFKRLFLAPWRCRWQRLFLGFMTALLCTIFIPVGLVKANLQETGTPLLATKNSQQTRTLFETNHYDEAIQQLQQAIEDYQNTSDHLNQALALRNLAFVYQQLGRWPEARQTITVGFDVIEQLPAEERSPILARMLDIQGHLYLSQGQAADALQQWQSATDIYTKLGDENRRLRSILTQVQALQAMGHYRRAIVILSNFNKVLADQPDSEIKATGLQLWGESLRIAGDLEQAEYSLQSALAIAQALNLSQLIGITQISLGHTVQAQGQLDAAQQYYQQASIQAETPITTVQAQLSELAILVNTQQWQQAEALVRQIQPMLVSLPPSQPVVYAKINLAENWLRISQRNAPGIETSHHLGATHSTTLPSTYTQDTLNLIELFINHSTGLTQGVTTETGERIPRPEDSTTYTRNNLDLVEQLLARWRSIATVPTISSSTVSSSTVSSSTIGNTDTYTRNNINLIDIFLGSPGHIPQIEPVVDSSEQSLSPRTQATIVQLLQRAQKDTETLRDLRSESYVLGSLGHLYEQTKQWQKAKTFTQKALLISQSLDVPEISYRWQWQLGRIFKAQLPQSSTKNYQNPNYTQAVNAYSAAVKTLQILRSDLVAINPDVQAAFQAGVEPIHRELVSLLLADTTAPPENLEDARNVIESLQLAELDNFFREACLSASPVLIDQVDRQAAVIYPIILPDRLDIVVRLPGQPLRHYSSAVSKSQLEATVLELRQALVDRTASQRYLALSKQVYDWLVQPLSNDLDSSDVNTLVFVSDGVLRNVPMAALYDGQTYLMERYAIALTPGLQLLEATPINPQNLGVLTAGLTEARQGFPALPNVAPEITAIETQLSAQKTLLNQDFTSDAFAKAVRTTHAPIVHLATHGQFSSNFDETFILTWDDRLSVHELRDLLLTTGLNQTTSNTVELLVLSACETAIGDQQAALGLAGTAVRSGARSTLGSLWRVSDEATSLLISRFYAELTSGHMTKAEALRRAQRSILENPRFRQHPFFWAPYVLIGNWL